MPDANKCQNHPTLAQNYNHSDVVLRRLDELIVVLKEYTGNIQVHIKGRRQYIFKENHKNVKVILRGPKMWAKCK